jgi:LysR family transcriptional regulator, hypochlorite-specific transcription factor HypT
VHLSTLEDFIAFAQLRNFSRAAERRHSTQSAFSRRMQSLESWVGTLLIDRRTVPPKLTAAGELFYEIAEEVLRTVRQGREEVLIVANQTRATVSFAVTHSLSLTFFPRWIRGIEREVGPVSLKLWSNDGDRCREALGTGECHFMICHFDPRMSEAFNTSRLRSLTLAQDRLIPASRPDASGRPLAVLPGRREAKVPFLTYTQGSSIGRSLELFLQDKQPFLEPCFETSLAEGVKAMILEGHGIGWLPEAVIRHELQEGKLVRAADESWDINIEIRIFRPATRLPKHAENLWRVIAGAPAAAAECF